MKINNYYLNTNKNVADKNFAILSDIHLNSKMSLNTLNKLKEALKSLNPDHILICGDLYDSNSPDVMVVKENEIDFLNSLSKIANTSISLGDSEIDPLFKRGAMKESLKKYGIPYSSLLYINSLNKINYSNYPVRFVGNYTNNRVISDDNYTISGLNFDYNFYHNDNESVDIIIERYSNYIKEISSYISNDTFNILLCHSPAIINAYGKIDGLEKYDLVLSGHTHGNVIDDKFRKMLKCISNQNLDKLFNEYNKNLYIKENTTFLISDGINEHPIVGPMLKLFTNDKKENIELIKVRKKN